MNGTAHPSTDLTVTRRWHQLARAGLLGAVVFPSASLIVVPPTARCLATGLPTWAAPSLGAVLAALGLTSGGVGLVGGIAGLVTDRASTARPGGWMLRIASCAGVLIASGWLLVSLVGHAYLTDCADYLSGLVREIRAGTDQVIVPVDG